MRLPRVPRFTVRRLMVAIAIAAIVCEFIIADRRFERLLKASHHASRQGSYERAGVRHPWDDSRDVRAGGTARYWATYHAGMKRKWEHAAARPWLIVPADPQ